MSREQLTPERRMAAAALDVVLAVAESNLRRKSASHSFQIPRDLVVALADELEAQYPGVIAEGRRIQKEAAP